MPEVYKWRLDPARTRIMGSLQKREPSRLQARRVSEFVDLYSAFVIDTGLTWHCPHSPAARRAAVRRAAIDRYLLLAGPAAANFAAGTD